LQLDYEVILLFYCDVIWLYPAMTLESILSHCLLLFQGNSATNLAIPHHAVRPAFIKPRPIMAGTNIQLSLNK
jgi:hypothetical protein